VRMAVLYELLAGAHERQAGAARTRFTDGDPASVGGGQAA